MVVNFDKANNARQSSLILCNPNGEKLFNMKMAKDRNIYIRLNGLSELSFVVPKYKDESIIPYYDYLITRRYVEIENVGRFIITAIETENDGTSEYKSVTCKGLEYELSSKNLGLIEGTYKFYDPSSADKSLMSIILSYLPNWKIGTIEDDLWNIYRTFDIKDNNIYNFLMTEVQEACRCIFIIDTFNRTISAKKIDTLIIKTDIFLSSRNVLKNITITEDAEDVKTALDVYGDGDLSIHSVNPLGTGTMYDFSYYKTVPDMMTKDLISAITKWETKFNSYLTEYSNLLTSVKDSNGETIKLETQLKELDTQLNVLKEEEAMKMTAGEDLSDVNARIEAKKKEIESKKNEINAQKQTVKDKQTRMKAINDDLKFSTNFTQSQLKELDAYIIQVSHQCTNFAITDAMSEVEKQETIQSLYDYGKGQLKNVSQPTYKFDIDVVNFLRFKKYKDIIDQLQLGCEITICVDRKKDLYAKAMLLGYEMNLDEPDNLTLHFSNKLKFGDDKYIWEELMDTSNSINSSINFESPSWGKAEDANSKIDDYINSALDLTQQEIINSDNQEFTLTRQGLRGREWDEQTQSYLPEQIWMNKNVLAFSDNGFTGRPRMALGKTLLPDGTYGYGLVADHLVGNLMLTKKLIVENENHTFKVDGDSVTIKNANIIMTNDGGSDKTLEEMLQDAATTGGNTVYRQPNPPSNAKENDLWFDTDDKNTPYVYKGGVWVTVKDTSVEDLSNKVANDISSAIGQVYTDMESMKQAIQDGEMVIFYQDTKPLIPPAKEGDMWYDTTIVNGKKKNEAWIVNGGTWNKIKDSDVTSALEQAQNAQTTADGKIKTYWQTTAPTGLTSKDVGDLWFDTDDSNKLYRWNGTQWIDAHDKSVDKISQDFTNGLTEINNKLGRLDEAIKDGVIVTYYQPTDPMLDADKNPKMGDLWFDTDDGKLYRHNGGKGKVKNIKDEKVELDSITDERETPLAILDIIGIFTQEDVTVNRGGTYSLPSQVRVLLNDMSEASLNVNWDTSGVNTNTPNRYTIYGNIQLISGITNTNNYKASIVLVVQDTPVQTVNITSVSQQEDIIVNIGETYSLPTSVLVNLSNSSSRYLNVRWNDNHVNTQAQNTYTVYGDISLENGITNPSNIRATIRIIVSNSGQGQQVTIESVESFSDIRIQKGQSYTLPSKALTQLSNGSSRYLDVRWDTSGVSVGVEATYTVYGDIYLESGITNPNNIRCIIQIIVGKGGSQETLNIIDVINPSDVTIQKGGTLSLPRQVEVRLSNSTTRQMEVNWNTNGVNTNTPNRYTIYGNIQLTSGITNTNNLRATIVLIVQDIPTQSVNITSVINPSNMTIVQGTSLNLPEQVGVRLSDSTTRYLNVVWNTAGVDTSQIRTYDIYGNITLTQGITNNSGLRAKIQVTIQAKPAQAINITSVEAIPDIVVVKGKTYKLPETALVNLSNGTRKYLNVYWNANNVNVYIPNTYPVQGVLSLTDGITNNQNLKAKVNVIVKETPTGVWDPITDKGIVDAIEKAQNAQTTADGKISTYYQTNEPTISSHPNLSEGDIWVDTDNGNRQHRYTNGQWVDISDVLLGTSNNMVINSLPNKGDTKFWNGFKCTINNRTDWDGSSYFNIQNESNGSPYMNSKYYRCEPNTDYTLSFEYYSTDTASYCILGTNVEQSINDLGNAYIYEHGVTNSLPINSTFTRKTFTFKTKSDEIYFYIRFKLESQLYGKQLNIKKIKLEKGTKATAWSKSPSEEAFYQVSNITRPDGSLDANQMKGEILAGKTNIICSNVATGRILALNENGIIVGTKVGETISEEGTFITKDGINADKINTGTLRSLKVIGCDLEVSNNNSRVLINPNDGIKIQKKTGITWNDTLSIDIEGDAVFKGKLEGNSLNINNRFTVDRSGNCVAKSIKISGASSELDAKDMIIRNLVVGQNVFMGDNAKITWGNLPDDVAGLTDVPNDRKIKDLAISEVGVTLGITHTTIGRAYIESPNIRGAYIEGGTISQTSSYSDNWGNCQLIGGRLQLLDKSNSYLGAIMGDNSDKKMWIEGKNALKLQAYNGDVSINPQSSYGNTSNGKIYLYGQVVVVGGKITDENGKDLKGSAVFG